MRLQLGFSAFPPPGSGSGWRHFLFSCGFGLPRLGHLFHDVKQYRDAGCLVGRFLNHTPMMTPKFKQYSSILHREEFKPFPDASTGKHMPASAVSIDFAADGKIRTTRSGIEGWAFSFHLLARLFSYRLVHVVASIPIAGVFFVHAFFRSPGKLGVASLAPGSRVLGANMNGEFPIALTFVVPLHFVQVAAMRRSRRVENPGAFGTSPCLHVRGFDPYHLSHKSFLWTYAFLDLLQQFLSPMKVN